MNQAAMFNENGVQVHADRLVVYGQTVLVQDGDRLVLQPGARSKLAATVLLLIGLAVVALSVYFASGPALILGLMAFIASFIAWRFQNVRHTLQLIGTSSSRTVVDSTDLAWLERIQAAFAQRKSQDEIVSTANTVQA
ncbi:hypothetical protein SAMN05216551_109207 [Chitinasiproducens palmae]|uniref:Uncharacterized protein n=2 Tax=Chitinasiproducens palmae TaxID=1770053 RepID=A0A1H2PSD3_9BURK|nr:hypothetical protein SAMN05216551_109207 [Chitinasiproducens palmae]